MFRNYFKIALRNISRHKGYSAINIAGLAIGIAACLLLFLVVRYEITYDKYNSKFSRIYRVVTQDKYSDGLSYNPGVPCPLLDVLRVDMPQLTFAGLDAHYGSQITVLGRDATATNSNKKFIESSGLFFVEPQFFDILDYTWLSGTPAVLKEPNMSVLTKSMAEKYFGNWQDAVGQFIRLDNNHTMKVAGVLTDPPGNTDWPVRVLSSYETLRHTPDYGYNTEWGSTSSDMEILALLPPNVSPGPIDAQLKAFAKKRYNDSRGTERQHYLQPSSDFHFDSRFGNFGDHVINKATLWTLSLIGLLIIVMASINFVNLSTAQAIGRSKEVGVRKVLGSMRGNLIAQFLSESILVSFLALVLACVIAWSVLPYFNQLSGKELTRSQLLGGWMLPASLLIVLLVGLLAGSYPAFYLSAFQPIQVLKGRLVAGFKTGWLRNSLVVFQFAISIFLIIGTVVIYNQLNYIQQKNLGFNRDQVLVIHNSYALKQQAKAFREEITRMPAVESATMTGYLPTNLYRNDNTYFLEPTMDQHAAISLQTWFIDDNYIPTLGMQMAAGRNFSKDMPTDSQGVILNEAAVKMLGLRDPLNYKLYSYNDPVTKKVQNHTIVGVVKDFNFNSLRQEVTPLGLFLGREQGSMAFRVRSTELTSLVNRVEHTWKTMAPGQPFIYSFMDEDFDAIYKAEQRTGRISITFSALAILIACLGLFGLAAYAAEQRTKEIGIRKVLGASVRNIINMLSKDFLKLVLIAALITFPFAWWAMNAWLQSFAYRIRIGWWVFALTGLLALMIAVLTVSFQAIRAALANPARSLRSE